MPTYVCLLRGINVSGHRPVKMEALRALFARSGFDDVRTYVQSGNVVFHAPRSPAGRLSAVVSEAIERTLGVDVHVVVRTGGEIARVVEANPFAAEPGVDPRTLHVAFLDRAPGRAGIAALRTVDAGADRWALVGREVFLHCPGGSARSKVSNNVLERKLDVGATTRNWRTVNALAAMSA